MTPMPVSLPHVPAAASYRLAPAMAMARFGDEALIFLSGSETFITVNRAAANLFDLMRDAFDERAFRRQQLVSLLLQHYEMADVATARATGTLLNDWTSVGILIRTQAADPASHDMMCSHDSHDLNA